MNIKKSITLAASLAVLGTGAAIAAPPSGFTYNDYTVSAGVITAGACPVGYTCQALFSDPGFLQQRISDGTAAGTFYRTIVLNEDAEAADAAAVDALAFRHDTFVGVSDNSGTIASLGKVALDVSGAGTGTLTAELARGDLNAGEAGGIEIRQDQNLGDRTVAFSFDEQLDGSESLRMDQINPVGGNYSGPMTVRRTTGTYTVCAVDPCTLELPDGQTLEYNSGDSIGVMYQHQALFSMGPVTPGDRVFENQRFTSGASSITWTNAVNHMTASGEGGTALPVPTPTVGGTTPAGTGGGAVGGVTFNTVNLDGGAWDYWDANFGTAPTGVTAPATFPATPFEP